MDRKPESAEFAVAELTELAVAAGAEVCGQFIVSAGKLVAATFIGKGKVAELAFIIEQNQIKLALFDHALSAVQERNLEAALGCRVLDREGLILDIFAQRASSSEGKLQVELAQLRRLSTRLVRGWRHLERQKGGIGLRGPGETQLETDRRLIGIRIKTLTKRLAKVESQRALRRRARHRTPIPTVSLVGYTNAGKSSLFNALTGCDVFAADQLFATLDPTMRRLQLPGFGAIVLSDTVGFVRDLPHRLVAAFHSTLEEVTTASCLLLVNDFAAPEQAQLKIAVENVLHEIGAGAVPRIMVNNKIDLLEQKSRTSSNDAGLVNKVWLSAQSGDGLDLLQSAIASLLGQQQVALSLRIAPGAGALRAALFQRCQVLQESADANGNMILRLRMAPSERAWLASQQVFEGLWQQLEVANFAADETPL